MTLFLSCFTSIRQVQATSESRLDFYANSWTKLVKESENAEETATTFDNRRLIDPSYWVFDCDEAERLDVIDENYLKETIQMNGHLGIHIQWVKTKTIKTVFLQFHNTVLDSFINSRSDSKSFNVIFGVGASSSELTYFTEFTDYLGSGFYDVDFVADHLYVLLKPVT